MKQRSPKQKIAIGRNYVKFTLLGLRSRISNICGKYNLGAQYIPGFVTFDELVELRKIHERLSSLLYRFDDRSRKDFELKVPEHRCLHCSKEGIVRVEEPLITSSTSTATFIKYLCMRHYKDYEEAKGLNNDK